jgi:hypothetical protein
MSELNYSNLLRQLVTDYLDDRVSRVEYLASRRDLLDRIDRDFNGEASPRGWSASDTARFTNPNDASSEDTLVPKP